MKLDNLYFILAGLLLSVMGCSDNDFDEQPSSAAGEEVVFGIDSEATKLGRTTYTGMRHEEGGRKFEGVDWVDSDKIQMYCAQSSNTQVADYSLNLLNPNEFGTSPQAQLVKMGAAGLQWGDSRKEHVFYGVYPSPKQFFLENIMEQPVLSGKSNGDVILKGYIPRNQKAGALRSTGMSTVVDPCMDYAYMAACTAVRADQIGQPVKLGFVPFVTAVELSFVNKTEHPINLNSVLVGSLKNPDIPGDYKPINGNFEAKLNNMANGGYPVITDVASQSEDRSGVLVSFFGEGGTRPVVLSPNGGTLTFTVFLHTLENLDNLVITLQSGSGFRRGIITGIQLEHHKKNFIHNIPLNSDFNVSNWISYLPDEAIVRELSIPGAGGVGGAYLSGTSVDEKSREQTLNIDELLNRGVRAFEISVSRKADNASGSEFGEIMVSCNGTTTSLNLKTAVSELLDFLSHNKREFAMLILTYQPMGDQARNANEFTKQLKKFWKNVKSQAKGYGIDTKLYEPDKATVGESRGKLFCIARPTSAFEDDLQNMQTGATVSGKLDVLPANVHPDILVINGWGSLKDKWQARGYTHQLGYGAGLNTADGSDGKPNRPLNFSYWEATATAHPVSPFEISYSALQPNFYYGIQAGSQGVRANGAWVQEWARVSKGVNIEGGYRKEIGENFWGKIYKDYNYSYYWGNSYKERCQRINETFDYAMNHKKGYITYINSLCGYYVDETVPKSVYPYVGTDNLGAHGPGGLSGNVLAYAKDINLYVYNNLFKKGLNEVTGPLGIILMNRVGSVEQSGQSISEANETLPYLIIANNFRFEMNKNENALKSGRSSQLVEPYDFRFDFSNHK